MSPLQRFPAGAEIASVWTLPVGRHIEIGARYKQNPTTAYCVAGCEECDPERLARCWQRRTQTHFVYRVREVAAFDNTLGRAYLVSLSRPDIWQMRAFCRGTDRMHGLEQKPEKWHTLTGFVWEAELGDDAP